MIAMILVYKTNFVCTSLQTHILRILNYRILWMSGEIFAYNILLFNLTNMVEKKVL